MLTLEGKRGGHVGKGSMCKEYGKGKREKGRKEEKYQEERRDQVIVYSLASCAK